MYRIKDIYNENTIYRIKAVLNVETDIITSITESLKMFVKTFKTDVIVFIGNITLTDKFHYQSVH
jgi:hypothetical protein